MFYFLDSQPSTPPPPPLPRMKKKDMTLTELKKYDGSDPDGRVCVAVLGKIYDVTKGKRFYGPGKYIFFNSFICTVLEIFLIIVFFISFLQYQNHQPFIFKIGT